MLDSAPGRPARETGGSTNVNSTSPTTSFPSSSAYLRPSSSPTKSSNESHFLRGNSPKEHSASCAPLNRPFRAFSNGTPPRSFVNGNAHSPEVSHPERLSVTSLYSPRSDTGARYDWKVHPNKKPTIEPSLDRPISQPHEHSKSIFDKRRTKIETDILPHHQAKQEGDAIKDTSLRQANNGRVSSFEFQGRQAQLERQQRLEREKKMVNQGSPREDRPGVMNYPFLTQSSVFSEPPLGVPRSENKSVIDRLLDRSYQANANLLKASPSSEGPLRPRREERQRPVQRSPKSPPALSRHAFTDIMDEHPSLTSSQNATPGPVNSEGKYRMEGISQQVRTLDDGIQNHRSMLALINDNGKRTGRISPLPQAVQGAQGQKRGPSSDPSIKNEFSRMFAGIGSGVGSTGLNSGASTPLPPSPKQSSEIDQRLQFAGRSDLTDIGRSYDGSRLGNRGRRIKEDESKSLETLEDQTMTGSGGMRGIRKGRNSQPHHHHLNR